MLPLLARAGPYCTRCRKLQHRLPLLQLSFVATSMREGLAVSLLQLGLCDDRHSPWYLAPLWL